PWLPLPHLLMAPFAAVDSWWYSGIAAAPPAALCFVAGGLFFFAGARRVFSSTAAALAAAALAALNPNLLYLQSTSMTEAYFFAELAALLYFTVAERPIPAALATIAATLTRYEGWFLIPFVAIFFLTRKPRGGVFYLAVASLGPLYWLFHNWYLTGDALAFYRGPYSARAIQAGHPYPGLHEFPKAWLYYRTAVRLCTGLGLPLMAMAGAVVALARRAVWPLLLLALPPLFYLWSMYSSAGTPIFVPTLWPHSWYNTRYGLAALPLLAFASAALVMAVPTHLRATIAVLVVVAGTIHWAVHPRLEDVVTWAESRANSTGRRAWMYGAADFLGVRYRPGQGIATSGGDDLFGIYRAAAIPLAETFSVDNGLPWDAAIRRPEILWQDWALARKGDDLDNALARAVQAGVRYELLETIAEKDEPVIEIYRRR
ncbi:MAG TPA: hypothetical protein VMU19_03765, partial [Bryobacteraceae bacterium]|nr:hypothetical protein [Bryobacteraceae bacterium]